MTQDRPLTPKQKRFVEEYLVDLNATRAYKTAYGCEQKGAEANGARLIRDDRVAARVANGLAKASERNELTLDSHLSRLDALGKEAARAGQFSAAISAEAKRGEAVGLYIRRTEDVTKLSPEQREERVLSLLKRRGLKLEKAG